MVRKCCRYLVDLILHVTTSGYSGQRRLNVFTISFLHSLMQVKIHDATFMHLNISCSNELLTFIEQIDLMKKFYMKRPNTPKNLNAGLSNEKTRSQRRFFSTSEKEKCFQRASSALTTCRRSQSIRV